MKRNELLALRLRELFHHGKWIANTNYKEQLQSISLSEATQKVGNLNSITLLAFHINYYLKGLLNVMEGGALNISDKYSFSMPELHTENDWKQLAEALLHHAETFAMRVEQMPEETLDAAFVDAQYGTWQRNIEAVIEHGYYHLGQIALLRKLITQPAS